MRGFVLAALLVLPLPGLGWNDHGHMLTAAIAWQVMERPARRAAIRALRAHPRYHEDFLRWRPAAVAGSAAMDEWLFLRASIWPDLVRRLPDRERERFHHGRWHYINQPLFLSPGQARRWRGSLLEDLGRAPSDPGEMNAVQAYRAALATLRRRHARAEDRGLALSWLIHIAGDLHQPLHTVSLYHRPAFPHGDRGGNDLRVDAKTTLHGLWDGALGDDRDIASLGAAATRLRADRELVARVRESARELDPEVWLSEGLRSAERDVYTDEIRTAIRAAPTETDSLPIPISPAYRQAMVSRARERILTAGLRLGRIMNELAKTLE